MTTPHPDALAGLLRFERMLGEISAPLVGATAADVRARIRVAIGQVVELFGLERGSFAERVSEARIELRASAAAPGRVPLPEDVPLEQLLPWYAAQLHRGEVLRLHVDQLPRDLPDQPAVQRFEIRSHLSVPIHVAGQPAFFFGMSSSDPDYEWPEQVVGRLKLLGEMFAAAYCRTRAEEAQRNSEAQLRQTQKMEAIGSLAAGVAHDFNNILSVILSYSSMLLDGLAPDDPRREDVSEIRTAAERAARLTRQLLAFSRRETTNTTRVDPTALVRDLVKMLRRLIPEHIELQFDLRARGQILADPGQLEQVLLNLCLNARDAMPTGGRLLITCEDVDLSPAEASRLRAAPGPHVRLTVRDGGTGMDEATRARIFEPFFTTKERGRGTGLGLALVFAFVQQSHGAIEVTSEPGRGSTFELFLPVTAEVEDEPEDAALPSALARGGETILLVEDDPQVRNVMRAVLERRGYRVRVADDPLEALATFRAQREPIALLLTDVVMPKMSGFQLAAEVSRLSPTTKLVCMSGYSDATTAGYGETPPGAVLLEKPILPDDLARRIREALDAPG